MYQKATMIKMEHVDVKAVKGMVHPKMKQQVALYCFFDNLPDWGC